MGRPHTDRADAIPGLAEVFRTFGFDGASLALIIAGTGLGKGSLYHFFPGGKEEMAAAVLDHIDSWFELALFRPLREATDASAAIRAMFRTVDDYFWSGGRVCLIGAFALGDARDRFAQKIATYFAVWRDDLASALRRAGKDEAAALALAEDTVVTIQGALVACRALDDRALFKRSLDRQEARLELPA
jgi:TetR/AcrR family transcriptional repressor of lmrAB and yxaGH operons